MKNQDVDLLKDLKTLKSEKKWKNVQILIYGLEFFCYNNDKNENFTALKIVRWSTTTVRRCWRWKTSLPCVFNFFLKIFIFRARAWPRQFFAPGAGDRASPPDGTGPFKVVQKTTQLCVQFVQKVQLWYKMYKVAQIVQICTKCTNLYISSHFRPVRA